MSFFIEYFKLIDLLALAALAALAGAALVRDGSVWLFVAGILVAVWGDESDGLALRDPHVPAMKLSDAPVVAARVNTVVFRKAAVNELVSLKPSASPMSVTDSTRSSSRPLARSMRRLM